MFADHQIFFWRNFIFLGLLTLILLRVLFLVLAVHDIPDLHSDGRTGWFSHYGGDSGSYFLGTQFLIGEAPNVPKAYLMGYSLFLVPLSLALSAETIEDIAPVAVVLNSVVLYGMAIMLIYLIARFFLARYKAFIISAVFTVYPYIFYFFFRWFAEASPVIMDFATSRFQRLMFFTVESEALSLVLVLSSLLIVLHLIRGTLRFHPAVIFSLGIIVSYALITRIQNGILVPLYALLMIYLARYKEMAWFVAGIIPFVLFQLYSNVLSTGFLFDSPYSLTKHSNDESISAVSLLYPLRLITYPLEYSPLLLILVMVFFAVLVLGIRALLKSHGRLAVFLAFYLALSTIPILFLEPTMRNPRYFLPVFPAIGIFIYVGIETLIWKLKERLNAS